MRKFVFIAECDLSSLSALGDCCSDIIIQNAGFKICFPEDNFITED
jgi:hypothetical protein